MTTETFPLGAFACPLVQVGQDGSGAYTAQVVGLPAIQASAATRDEAIEQVRAFLNRRLSSGQLVALPVVEDQGCSDSSSTPTI